MRKFHIWDFPSKTIILLEDEFRFLLFNILIEKCGSIKNLANKIGRNYRLFYSWKNNKACKSQCFIPLTILKSFIKIIQSSNTQRHKKCASSSFVKFNRFYLLFKDKDEFKTNKNFMNLFKTDQSVAHQTMERLVKERYLTKKSERHRDENGKIHTMNNQYRLTRKGKVFIKKVKKIEQNPKDEIEKHIIAYKTFNGTSLIKHPKLPVTETPELISIIFNLLGDGSDLKNAGEYSNTNKYLLKNFENRLKNIFGDVHVRYNMRKNGLIRFPKILVNLLRKLYNIEFGTFSGDVPQILFKLPKEYTFSALRSLVDDDGNVTDNDINITSGNEKLVKKIAMLIKLKISVLKNCYYISKNGKYFRLHINAGGLKFFLENIKLNHPHKLKELIFQVERIKRGRTKLKPLEIKRNILLHLNKHEALTTKEICRYLYMKNNTALKHLSYLDKCNLVEKWKLKHNGISYIWRITNKGTLSVQGGGKLCV